MERSANQTEQSARQGASQAKRALDATIAASRLDERAWVAQIGIALDAPEIGKPVHGYVTWNNSGKTFARKVKPLCHFVFVPKEVATENELIKTASKGTAVGNSSIGVLAPNGQYKTLLESQSSIDESDKAKISGTWYIYIWGEITYEDIFKRPHTTVFCSRRQGATADFTQCPFHNDAD